ncbi:MAG: tetratricopeptide repeat protein, partial [Pseudomonadota bacterium]
APDTDRRYGTAGALADDLTRWQRGEPVHARPDSSLYRARRWVGRNRATATALSAMMLAIVGGLVASLWQASVAREQSRQVAEQLQRTEAVSEFLGDILLSPSANWDSKIQTGTNATIADVLDVAELRLDQTLLDQPQVRIELLMRLSEARLWLDQPDRGEALARKAVALVDRELPDHAQLRVETRYRIGGALSDKPGQAQAAIAQYIDAMDEARRLGLEDSFLYLYILNDRAMVHMQEGEADDALSLMSEAIARLHESVGDSVQPSWCVGYNNLAFAQFLSGDLEGAEASFARALDGCEAFPAQNTLSMSSVLNNYANLHALQGDSGRALAMHERALKVSRPLMERGGGEEDFALSASGMALRHCEAGRPLDGQRALTVVDRELGAFLDRTEAWIYFVAHAECDLAAGDAGKALLHARRAVALGQDARRTPDHVSRRQIMLARALIANGQADAAHESALLALEAYTGWLGPEHAATRQAHVALEAAL